MSRQRMGKYPLIMQNAADGEISAYHAECSGSGNIRLLCKRRKKMIIVNIDVMLAKRKMSVTELSQRVGITMANISILKNGKAKAIKIETLNKICEALDCQPGDILEWREK
jgi:putative transcriptional regulator